MGKIDKQIKDVSDSAKDLEEITEDGEITQEEKGSLARVGSKIEELLYSLEEKTRYTSLLELFNIKKLDIITELDKQKVQDITKFETYMASQKDLYGLDDDDPALLIVQDMIDSYRTNMISYKRKSRTEVKDILKEPADNQRNIGRIGK